VVERPSTETHTKLIAQIEQFGTVLGPEILQLYRNIHESLPVLIVQALDAQLKREYRYAVGGQIVAAIALILMAGGFVYLVMNGHERPAYLLLGAGVLNTIGGFLRARLSERARGRPDSSEQGDKPKR
jgi:hypothetical protein